jgi:hypothetical protein
LNRSAVCGGVVVALDVGVEVGALVGALDVWADVVGDDGTWWRV